MRLFSHLVLPRHLLLRLLFWGSAVAICVGVYFGADWAIERAIERPKAEALKQAEALTGAFDALRAEMMADGERIANRFQELGYIDFGQHLDLFHRADGSPYPLAVYVIGGGKILEAYLQQEEGLVSKAAGTELHRYQPLFHNTFANAITPPTLPLGILILRGTPFFVTTIPVIFEGQLWPSAYIILGRELGSLTVHLPEGSTVGFFEVFPSERLTAIGRAQTPAPILRGVRENDFFGTYGLGTACFEAIFPLFDMTGLPVARYTLRLPAGLPVLAAYLRLALPLIAFAGLLLLVLLNTALMHIGIFRPIRRLLGHLQGIHADSVSGISNFIPWARGEVFSRLVDEINRLLLSVGQVGARAIQVERSQRMILRNIPDGLCVFDREGTLMQLRKQPEGVAPIPGLTEGHGLDEQAFDRAGRKLFRETCNTVLTRGEASVIRLSCRTPGEAPRYFEARFSKLGNETILVIFTDISRRVREAQRRTLAEVQLRQSRQRSQMNDFARFMAHDINNTIAVIQSVVEAINPESPEDVRASLHSLRNACNKGTLLARDLMDSSGNINLKCKSESPATLLLALETFYVNALPANVHLQIDPVPPGTGTVLVDPTNFWRILSNITRNASEALAAHGGGTIHIRAKACSLASLAPTRAVVWPEADRAEQDKTPAHRPGVLFELSDNGPGIPEALQEHLFEPAVSTKGGLHRGFGMAIVRALVEAHGGALAFRSIVGRGTAFRIWVPAGEEVSVPQLEEPTVPCSPQRAEALLKTLSEEATPPPRHFTCLVVDDDSAIRTASKTLLERFFEATVFVASTPTEALEALRHHPDIAVALVDAHLGQETSQALCAELRERAPALKLVITSGLSREHIDFLFKGLKPDGILPKPWMLADLRTLLAALLTPPAFPASNP
ncbi:MAG: ATP-binding protein [Candidatus Spyradenecus sp.]